MSQSKAPATCRTIENKLRAEFESKVFGDANLARGANGMYLDPTTYFKWQGFLLACHFFAHSPESILACFESPGRSESIDQEGGTPFAGSSTGECLLCDKNGGYCWRHKKVTPTSSIHSPLPEQNPIARLQQEISDLPFGEQTSHYDIVILDRNRCTDDLLLFASPDKTNRCGVDRPVARLQSTVSDRPFSEGKLVFDIIILDRSRCTDGMLLYARCRG